MARRLDVLDVEWLDGSTRRARLDVLDVEWLDVLDVLDVEWLDVEWLDVEWLDVLDVEWLDCQCSTRLDSTCSTSSGSRRALSTCSLDVERATRRLDVLDVLDSTSREPLDGSTCSTARLDVLDVLDGSTARLDVEWLSRRRVESSTRKGPEPLDVEWLRTFGTNDRAAALSSHTGSVSLDRAAALATDSRSRDP